MSANPTRVDWESPVPADPGFPLQEGNRVLESIASQEALRALLAFSDLHEQIRKRRVVAEGASNRDLFETERFIFDEALQLVCDRLQAITQADGILIALTEESQAERNEGEGLQVEKLIAKESTTERPGTKLPDLVCRASAGPVAVKRGVRLIGESEFLQDCLDSGRILRCDDCDIDARVELDFARHIGGRSTVLVPLRGRREQLGVLQAFSLTPWAFTDNDILRRTGSLRAQTGRSGPPHKLAVVSGGRSLARKTGCCGAGCRRGHERSSEGRTHSTRGSDETGDGSRSRTGARSGSGYRHSANSAYSV